MPAPCKVWIVGSGAQGKVTLDLLRASGRHQLICLIDDHTAPGGSARTIEPIPDFDWKRVL